MNENKIEKIHELIVNPEEFNWIYCKIISSVYDIKYTDDLKILVKLFDLAEYSTGKVLLPSLERKLFCTNIGIQSSNVSKSLKRLRDKELIDGSKGSYIISPKIFWKINFLEELKNGVCLTFKITS